MYDGASGSLLVMQMEEKGMLVHRDMDGFDFCRLHHHNLFAHET